MRTLALSAVLFFVAACGGSGSTSVRTFQAPEPAGIDILRDNISRLETASFGTDATPFTEINVPGGATYSGALAVGFLTESAGGIGFGGDLEMNVNLETMELNGEIDNFFDRDGEAMAGQVALVNASAREFGGFSILEAELSGRLEILTNMSDVSGSLLGSLGGETGEFARGSAEIILLDDEGAPSPVSFQGGFIAERQ